MSETHTTHYSDKCNILADLWLNYRGDNNFADFVDYNDLGLPLAYSIAENVVVSTDLAEVFINETFDLLLGAVGIEEDTGFDTLDDVLEFGTDGQA